MLKNKLVEITFAVACVFLFSHSAAAQFEVFPDEPDGKTTETKKPERKTTPGLNPFGATPDDFPANPPAALTELDSPFSSANDLTTPPVGNSTTILRPKKNTASKSTAILNSTAMPKSKAMPKSTTFPKSTAATSSKRKSGVNFDDRFWLYLKANNYKNWSAGPSAITDLSFADSDAHGSYVKLYMNRTAAGNASKLPDGSVIVLENFDQFKSLDSISVMYRSDSYNKKSKNWYWVEYKPDGSLVQQISKNQSGVINSCIECHSGAGGGDMSYFNDQIR